MPRVQRAAIAAATLAAVLAESTLGKLLALPAALVTEVARTPPARLPAAALLLLLVAATYVQFRRSAEVERAWRIAASVVRLSTAIETLPTRVIGCATLHGGLRGGLQ